MPFAWSVRSVPPCWRHQSFKLLKMLSTMLYTSSERLLSIVGQCLRTTTGPWTESLVSRPSSNRRATRFPRMTWLSWWLSTGSKTYVGFTDKVDQASPKVRQTLLTPFCSPRCVYRAEKTSKLQTVPGTLDIAVDYIPMEHPSMSTLKAKPTFVFFFLPLSASQLTHPLCF